MIAIKTSMFLIIFQIVSGCSSLSKNKSNKYHEENWRRHLKLIEMTERHVQRMSERQKRKNQGR